MAPPDLFFIGVNLNFAPVWVWMLKQIICHYDKVIFFAHESDKKGIMTKTTCEVGLPCATLQEAVKQGQ